jgi:hypothetical protein
MLIICFLYILFGCYMYCVGRPSFKRDVGTKNSSGIISDGRNATYLEFFEGV